MVPSTSVEMMEKFVLSRMARCNVESSCKARSVLFCSVRSTATPPSSRPPEGVGTGNLKVSQLRIPFVVGISSAVTLASPVSMTRRSAAIVFAETSGGSHSSSRFPSTFVASIPNVR